MLATRLNENLTDLWIVIEIYVYIIHDGAAATAGTHGSFSTQLQMDYADGFHTVPTIVDAFTSITAVCLFAYQLISEAESNCENQRNSARGYKLFCFVKW